MKSAAILVWLSALILPGAGQIVSWGGSPHWTLRVIDLDEGFLGWATLISLRKGLTTCSCAVETHFIYPEFNVRPQRCCKMVAATRYKADSGKEQQRIITEFVVHPKCASSFNIAGFFDFNYAIAEAESPFDETPVLLQIALPSIDYEVLEKTLFAQREYRCGVVLEINHKPVIHWAKYPTSETCSAWLCKFGMPCHVSLTERAVFCIEIDIPHMFSKRACDGVVARGAPYVCDGLLMGVVSLSQCKWNILTIVARIEPSIGFMRKELMDKLQVAPTEPTPTPSCARYWAPLAKGLILTIISQAFTISEHFQ